MSTEQNVQTVKDFFAAIGRRDGEGLLALTAEAIEWVIPGEDWPLAGTHRGHAGLADLLRKAYELETSWPKPLEYVAQGDRVVAVGFATGKVKATNQAFEDHFVFARGKVKATNKPFEDDWIFAITVRDGKLTSIQEYVDTQGAGRAGGRVRAGVALAVCSDRFGVDGGRAVDRRRARRALVEC